MVRVDERAFTAESWPAPGRCAALERFLASHIGSAPVEPGASSRVAGRRTCRSPAERSRSAIRYSATLAQRSNLDVEHAEAVERSSRKSPRSTAFRRSRLVAAITRMFAFTRRVHRGAGTRALQHPQKLRLRGEAHLGDLVEEQHASRRELHLTGLCLLRAGERASLVAKQLRLKQLLGQRGAIQRDEWPALRADAAWMNRATTSLPVPDSPVTGPVVSVEATALPCAAPPRHSTDSPTTRRWAPAAS